MYRNLLTKVALLTAALCIVLSAAPANAQATRTWVSGVGDDANPCSRTAPCKTFAGAISKTAAGGEISVLDPGGFGAVTITKSISIVNDDSGEAGILASGTNGITVNAAATDIVILRGLVIDGAPPASPGLNGVRFLAGAALHIEKTLIKNFTATSAGNGNGILFAPASGTSELYVANSTLINNSSTVGSGISVLPTGSGSALVSINRTELQNNRIGIQASTGSTTGTITVGVSHSSVSGSTSAGVSAVTLAAGGTAAAIIVGDSLLVGNGTGVSANGNAATVRIGSSIVTGSTSGAVGTANSGTVTSYKNNQVDNNVNNNTPIPQSNLN
jgi:hypothetical protein